MTPIVLWLAPCAHVPPLPHMEPRTWCSASRWVSPRPSDDTDAMLVLLEAPDALRTAGWQTGWAPPRRPELVDAGLDPLDLREPRMVGRQHERALLWAALRQASGGRRAQVRHLPIMTTGAGSPPVSTG